MVRTAECSKLPAPLYCVLALQAPLAPLNEYFTMRAKRQQLKHVTPQGEEGKEGREEAGPFSEELLLHCIVFRPHDKYLGTAG